MKHTVSRILPVTVAILGLAASEVRAQFTSADIGSPAVPGSTATVAGGFNISGGGSDIGGTNDQFHFNYQEYVGDFDVQVRLESISLADAWAKAGVIARENLTAGGRYAGAFSTPNIGGSFFQFRMSSSGPTTNRGSAPVTYPNTWLRLKRVGDVFSGFAGLDGGQWQQLGTVTLPTPPASMLVGMAVTSRSTNQVAVGQFRSFANVVGNPPIVTSLPLKREPVGPSSRRTGLVISEIMYHPRTVGNFTNNSLEFIEIFNSLSIPENLTGFRLSGSIGYAFPSNTVIPPGGYLVVARDPAFVMQHYGVTGVLGPWFGTATNNPGISTNALPGSEGLVRLRSKGDSVLLQVEYQGRNPWPIAADGSGHSLVLARPSYGEGDPKAWAASDSIDGSPGRGEPFSADRLSSVVINEFLANTDEPAEDYIELYNYSKQDVDLSGAYLTDEASTNKFRIPNGISISATGFVYFTQGTLGFSLRSTGERIFLVNSNQTRVIDAVDFGAQATGVSSGRTPDGAPTFSILSSITPGLRNSSAKIADVVINEIMYNPVTGNDDDEFVELYNRTASTKDVSGWRISGGITYTIPKNTLIPPNGYLVIANDRTNLLARFSNLNTTNTLGNYGGNLGNGGEQIALAFPTYSYVTNGGIVTTNTDYVVVNEVTYDDGGRWGDWSDGGGSSLELIDPDSDNRQPANWADSDESAKAPWTTVEVTGNMGELEGTANLLLVYLLGVGECLVDDVEVRPNGGANLVPNAGFESGLTSWNILAGSHDHSTLENTGFNSSRSLHIRAASRGDDSANSIRTATLAGIGTTNITLRAKVRWLRGYPEILLRLRGGGLEAPGRLALPSNLGSPGARNSRAVTNAGPVIYEVAHSPVLPAENNPVVISARVQDPHGISQLVVKYRVDSVNSPISPAMFAPIPMVDDGTSGDAMAGDGIFSATLPGQVKGAAIGFYIEASDAAPANVRATNTFPQNLFPAPGLTRCFPYDTQSRECMIRWGDAQMMGSFATYHLWVSLVTAGRWNDRHELGNAALDGTFVYNDYRVIYNCRPQFAGSPWHAGSINGGPTNNLIRMDYVCNYPEDDKFLGATDSVLNTVGNPENNRGTDSSGQSEQTAYTIFREMGIHYNYRRYFHFFVNGNQRSLSDKVPGGLAANSIMEDSQQPNTDVIEQWFPDDTDGELYKIEDWFAFSDTGFNASHDDADLGRRMHVVNGNNVPQVAAYRFMWRKRAVSPGESASDYTQFIKLLDAVSPSPLYPTTSTAPVPYPDALMEIADVEQWMRIFAVQHAIGNWDSYGYRRGKNAYSYKPVNGRFNMWTWDIDFTMGIGGDGSGQSLFDSGTAPVDGDGRVQGLWNTPVFRRMYMRAFQDMVNGVWNNSFLDPILDAKAQAFTFNNVSFAATGTDSIATIKSYIAARRTFILNQLNSVNPAFSVTGTNYLETANPLVTLTGIAPITMKEIRINGVVYPVTWTAINNWSARFVLSPGTNTFDIEGRLVTVVFQGTVPNPVGAIVFNELHYNPAAPDTSFVELLNTTASTFDLSGWRVNGLDFTFPKGSIITNGQFIVLVKNRGAYLSEYTNSTAFGQFEGNLDPDGETLTLLALSSTNASPDLVVDRVRYEARLPWPTNANGGGASLQLVDVSQDNSRPSNWTDRQGWQQVVLTGTVQGGASPGTNFAIFTFPGGGDFYIDDIVVVTGAVANAGQNLIVNGDFEAPLEPTWSPQGNHSGSHLVAGVVHGGTGALHVVGTSSGGPTAAVRQMIPTFAANTICTLSYWFLPGTNGATAQVRTFAGSSFNSTISIRASDLTPGFANNDARSLPAYAPLWLNELQADNTTGPVDNFGERDPWIELYNAGQTTLDLSGYYLADNYNTNLTQWQFPGGSSIAPGQFQMIWADGQTGQTSGTNLHTSFRLNSTTGSVALVRMVNGNPQITDYLTYSAVGSGQSYGDYPDGQPFSRFVMRDPTPGRTNATRFVNLYINEWMADNTHTLDDPGEEGNNFEDWFEIYNPGDTPIDIGGYFLTDSTSSNTNNFSVVPNNGQYVVPAHGFLLVWADDDAPQENRPSSPDLHVNFALGRGGDRIILYGPDGRSLIDRVDFGSQTNDVSQGRYPDGSLDIRFLGVPTPRLPNVLQNDNRAPQLAAIANRSVTLGQSTVFTITATDPDIGQSLEYSIVSGAPAGATLEGNSGVFTWVSSFSLAPSTNFVTVRVTDNGNPPLTDTESFTLIGIPPPPAISRNGNQLTITYQTIPGKLYKVQYKNDLSDSEWLDLAPAVQANGTSLSASDDLTGRLQRFYRIAQLE